MLPTQRNVLERPVVEADPFVTAVLTVGFEGDGAGPGANEPASGSGSTVQYTARRFGCRRWQPADPRLGDDLYLARDIDVGRRGRLRCGARGRDADVTRTCAVPEEGDLQVVVSGLQAGADANVTIVGDPAPPPPPPPPPQSLTVHNGRGDTSTFTIGSSFMAAAAPSTGTLAAEAGTSIDVAVNACPDPGTSATNVSISGGGSSVSVGIVRHCGVLPARTGLIHVTIAVCRAASRQTRP